MVTGLCSFGIHHVQLLLTYSFGMQGTVIMKHEYQSI